MAIERQKEKKNEATTIAAKHSAGLGKAKVRVDMKTLDTLFFSNQKKKKIKWKEEKNSKEVLKSFLHYKESQPTWCCFFCFCFFFLLVIYSVFFFIIIYYIYIPQLCSFVYTFSLLLYQFIGLKDSLTIQYSPKNQNP